jgi:hypothetical protein
MVSRNAPILDSSIISTKITMLKLQAEATHYVYLPQSVIYKGVL